MSDLKAKKPNKIAVIGGSQFKSLQNLSITHSTTVMTPYGEPSAPLCYGMLGEQEVVFLPRRGSENPMPPHKINYQANIWALRDAGVDTVIATAAVAACVHIEIGSIVIPDQLIDYTYNRENTFLGEDVNRSHIDFAHPYSEALRKTIIETAQYLDIPIIKNATYGIIQGPRLETLAEVKRYQNDGCHIVGMTGMPEATLARELGLDYACIATVIRQAAVPLAQSEDEFSGFAEPNIEKLVEAIILRTMK